MIELEDIVSRAPKYEGKSWAFFGTVCLYWTTDLRDLKKISNFLASPLGDDSCCPFCGGAIQQASLDEFITSAEDKPEAYGPDGLDALIAAHAINARTCRTRWERYKVKIRSD